MPDFTARIASGATLETWVDPVLAGAPSRLNPFPEHLHKYSRVIKTDTVTVSAKVEGVEGPLDAALDGRLFYPKWAEWPGSAPPLVTSPAGQSSVMSFLPLYVGHYLLVVRRQSGGGIAIPFDVEVLP